MSASLRIWIALAWMAPLVVFAGPTARTWDHGTLIQALRAGGYTIYFRHAETDWSQSDHVNAPGDWTSCDPARIRQLSETGRKTACRLGNALRALGLPVARVLASPYCRAVETARRLGMGAVHTTSAAMNLRVASYFGGTDAVVKRARALLARRPDPGSNTIVVAHGNLARAATSAYPGEAGALVIDSRADLGFEVVATLSPADWTRLAKRFGRSGGPSSGHATARDSGC